MKKAFSAWMLGITLVFPTVVTAMETQEVTQARQVIEQELEQDLLCGQPGEYARAGAHKDNSVLKAAGARITFDDTGDTYNNYIYRFDTPLVVKGLSVYSVSQTEGENGVIITAEAKGDPVALASELNAKPLNENEVVFGLGNELFHFTLSKSGRTDEIIIGADDEQKIAGHFYFGCSRGSDL